MLSKASYELQERGGWITSPTAGNMQLRRQSVQMFMEGSIFSECPAGQLANVTPKQGSKHPIYRSGIALSLPIRGQE
jgi:CRISPR-associated protein Csm4